jgi:hypothetical protein
VRAKIYEALATEPSLIYPHIVSLVENITPTLSFLRDRVDAYSKGLALVIEDKEYAFEHAAQCLQYCLRVLDAALVNELHEKEPVVENVSADLSRPVVVKGLVAVTVAMDVDQASEVTVVQDDVGSFGFLFSFTPAMLWIRADVLSVIACACKELSFRILVNLTNENKSLCKDLVADKMILPALIRMFVASSAHFDVLLDTNAEASTSEPYAAQSPDTLLLGLALLTNIVQEYKESSHWMHKLSESYAIHQLLRRVII